MTQPRVPGELVASAGDRQSRIGRRKDSQGRLDTVDLCRYTRALLLLGARLYCSRLQVLQRISFQGGCNVERHSGLLRVGIVGVARLNVARKQCDKHGQICSRALRAPQMGIDLKCLVPFSSSAGLRRCGLIIVSVASFRTRSPAHSPINPSYRLRHRSRHE